MELIKGLLEAYKLLLNLGDRARGVDPKVFSHIEEAAERVAAALTDLRLRGKLDPESEKELMSLLGLLNRSFPQ